MKRTNSLSTVCGALCALIFALCLTYGSLSGSDFPRGLYTGPAAYHSDSTWAGFTELNPNIIFGGRTSWVASPTNPTTIADYMDKLEDYNLKAILGKGDWSWSDTGWTDSITYLIEHHSWGQYNQLQVEWDSLAALENYNFDGSGYYHFYQYRGGERPDLWPGQWYMAAETTSVGLALKGMRWTVASSGWLYWEPEYEYPEHYEFGETGRSFRVRITARANLDGTVPSDSVFLLRVQYSTQGHLYDRFDSLWVTVDSFDVSLEWKQFWVEEAFDTSAADLTMNGIRYELYYWGGADVWIDHIEYLDMEQAYQLLWDNEMQAQTLESIADECDSLQDLYGNLIAGWSQSGESRQQCFFAHGVINEYLKDNGVLGTRYPHVPMFEGARKHIRHFFYTAKPMLYEADPYVFAVGGNVGDQEELSYLAAEFDTVYQLCEETGIDMRYTAQAHDWTGGLRNPTRSEILAESFIALAHGAKGLYFFRWLSNNPSLCHGLVDPQFNHSDPVYAEKWQAVQDVFAQLDSIGGTLLDLERDAAFCVAQAPNFQGAIDNIYFEDDDTDYIEVGQFHLPPSTTPDYLIIVNRRTDGDRHITVETDKTGTWALRDLYTQEQFISSTGDFKAIPFDSGEGRVFKLAVH